MTRLAVNTSMVVFENCNDELPDGSYISDVLIIGIFKTPSILVSPTVDGWKLSIFCISPLSENVVNVSKSMTASVDLYGFETTSNFRSFCDNSRS